jgi:DNA-binding LacI/PurR family transcriptional regulator
VSRGTVSRVLNGGRYVSPSSLAAVERAMRDIGYTVNVNARSLVTNQSNTVAFVLTEAPEHLFDDPNLGVLLLGCTKALAEHDVSLILMIAETPTARDRTLRYVRGGHVDGVLLISAHSGDPILSALEHGNVPAVACGRPLDVAIPYVAADDREGARQLTRHLRDRGCERLGIIAGPQDTAGGVDRLAGFRDVLGRKASKRLVAFAEDFGHSAGEAAMTELLARNPDLDGVFAASDSLASGALAALRRAGRRVPDDVAVGGFDDSSVAATTDPPLTTVRQPLDQVASELVDVLLGLIHRRPMSSRVLPTRLVVRQST